MMRIDDDYIGFFSNDFDNIMQYHDITTPSEHNKFQSKTLWKK